MRWFAFELRSELPAPAEQVWTHASTMVGVNHELWPLVRMTVPAAFRDRHIDEWAEAGQSQDPAEPIFRSWILLGGVVPYDRHAFGLERVEPGRAFAEHSRSLVMRSWRHDRRIEPRDGGCWVSDRVRFEPRIRVLGHVMRPLLRLVFVHRHRRLRGKFRWPTPGRERAAHNRHPG